MHVSNISCNAMQPPRPFSDSKSVHACFFDPNSRSFLAVFCIWWIWFFPFPPFLPLCSVVFLDLLINVSFLCRSTWIVQLHSTAFAFSLFCLAFIWTPFVGGSKHSWDSDILLDLYKVGYHVGYKEWNSGGNSEFTLIRFPKMMISFFHLRAELQFETPFIICCNLLCVYFLLKLHHFGRNVSSSLPDY